jgi:hypothetical protein
MGALSVTGLDQVERGDDQPDPEHHLGQLSSLAPILELCPPMTGITGMRLAATPRSVERWFRS